MFGDSSITIIGSNRLESLGWLLVTVVSVVLVSVLLFKILKIILKSFSKQGLFFSEKFKAPALFVVLFISLFIVEPFLKFDVPLQNFFHHSITILMIVTVAWVLIKGVGLIPSIVMKRYDLTSKDNLQARQVFTQLRLSSRLLSLSL
ncbi:MAG TPA: hypothetical protein VIH57_07995 [Bacteroidales bacterium]